MLGSHPAGAEVLVHRAPAFGPAQACGGIQEAGEVPDLAVNRPTLEDVYLKMIGDPS